MAYVNVGPGTWVPIEKRDTAWYVFHELFMCRVSNIQSRSSDHIRYFGMPGIGDPEYDREMANELIDTAIPISKMVEFYEKGVIVRVIKPSDTKLIYDYISNHLNAWKNKLESSGMNMRDAPINDLILMDKFANAVYEHAKYEFTNDYVDSVLARRMGSVMRVSRSNVLAPYVPKIVTFNKIEDEEEKPEEKRPTRTSMAETFVNARVSKADRKWR